MGVIYLLRHGQAYIDAYGPDARSRDSGGLTELGREQARIAGRALAQRVNTLDIAVAGSLARQQETAELVLDAFVHAPELDCDPRWDEYDFEAIVNAHGGRAASTDRELQRVVDNALTAWIATNPSTAWSGETYTAYSSRCRAALDTLVDRVASGRTVLVVSSSGTITNILSHIWCLESASWIAMSRTMFNGSITKLIVGRRGVSAMSVNEHAHLEIVGDSANPGLMTFR